LVCAGKGTRLKKDKPVLKIKGKPLFYHAYKAFKGVRAVRQIVMVMRLEHIKAAGKMIHDKRLWFVQGGKRRGDSVLNGLMALDESITHVLIHDGARPLITKKVIDAVISGLKKHPAVICALRARDTLKKVEKDKVSETIRRDNIISVQTPQGFKKELILRAYREFAGQDHYDDAQMVEKIGAKVAVVEGDTRNIKVTYPQDIELAKKLL